jgi:two-component system NtrC family response regulator
MSLKTTKKRSLVLYIGTKFSFGDVFAEAGAELEVDFHRIADITEFHKTFQADVLLLSVHPRSDGHISALSQVLEMDDPPEIIVLAEKGNPNAAEEAIRSGAWDYLEMPVTTSILRLTVKRALQYRAEKVSKHLPASFQRESIIGESSALMDCLELVAHQAAPRNSNVLITGESGTGKELIARAIHENSERSVNPFVVVDCAALPQTLVESVLFGHEKGAFTGAERKTGGLVEQADTGTLFLDEVGELPLAIQKTFLRVLQERTFRPVGSSTVHRSDFRIVSATNKDLDDLVARGLYRKDLLFRLRALTIEIPPLRQRKRDIKPLAIHYISSRCEQNGIELKSFSTDFFEVLMEHSWPGNIRELNQTLEFALTDAGASPVLFSRHLPPGLRAEVKRNSLFPPPPNDVTLSRASDRNVSDTTFSDPLPTLAQVRKEAVSHAEEAYLEELVRQTGGDMAQACRVAGLSRSRLYSLLKKYLVSPQNGSEII